MDADNDDREPIDDPGDEDRWKYERALLRYMIVARTGEGLPIVCAETLLRQFLDDISTEHSCCSTTTADLIRWALAESEECTDDPHRLCFLIWQSYRVMVGAFSYGYHPEWLCVQPGPEWGDPRFPAWSRDGKRVV